MPQPHFLLVPLPEQGHINPMLSLASHLAALGSTVTFVKAEKARPVAAPEVNRADRASAETLPIAAQHPAQQANNSAVSTDPSPNGTHTPITATNVRFWTLHHRTRGSSPSPELTDGSSRFAILKHTLAGLEERQGMVEKLVQESKASDAPITCIICDVLLCNWVMRLAKRQAILAAVLVPCSGVNFYLPYLLKLGKREETEELRSRFGLSGPPKETTKKAEETNKMSEIMTFFFKLFDDVEEASHILVNSFKHLESALLESLETSGFNFRFIGPCFPAWEAEDSPGEVVNSMAKQAGCAFTEDHACLAWLDRQEKGSVLLLSFGSEVSLDAEQVEELALGIEASGCKFLWVVRPDAPAHNLPQEDFRDRTSNIGMFVSWAPQRRVLQHQAVGGFLTHCGWNSTLESIFFGVPMLCLPLNGDQFLNAHLIHTHWKIGLPFGRPRTLVPRAEVEKAVRDLMGSDDLCLRIAQLQEAAHCAVLESQSSLSSFVQDIASNADQKRADSHID